MKPIIIVSPFICKALSIFIEIGAITLYPFIISRVPMSEVTLNHEKIHIKQQAELLVIGFYALYALWWVVYRLRGLSASDAYFNLPFELEAYAHERDMDYLETRKPYAWRQYTK